MRKVVCSHCHEIVHVHEALAEAHCVRCGQVLMMPGADETETRFTDQAPAIQPAAQVDWSAPQSDGQPVPLPDRYASWDEFRTLSPAVQRERMELAARVLPDLRRMKVLPLPENAPGMIDTWGHVRGTLEVPGEHRWFSPAVGAALMLIAVPLFWHALAMALQMPQQERNEDLPQRRMLILSTLMGVAFLLIGLWYIFIRDALVAATLWIFEDGLLWQCGRNLGVTRWEEIRDFRFVPSEIERPAYWITLPEKLKMVLSLGADAAAPPLLEYMEIRIAAAQLLPRLKRIFEGHRVQFGNVRLDRKGFRCFELVPWSDIERVVLEAQRLHIERRGKESRGPIDQSSVSFAVLVLALTRIMIEEATRL